MTITEGLTLGKQWLEHMTDCLNWKVLGPDLHNPYQAPYSYEFLVALASNRETLAGEIKLRCMADGFEVLTVRNYARLEISTEHPCLTQLSGAELSSYLKETGLIGTIESAIDKIQEQIREEVKRRNVAMDAAAAKDPFLRKKRTDPSAQPAAKVNANMRLVKK
jgi:hypothetical protein